MSNFEEVAVTRGERSGAAMSVAVHSTVLGPALGGARMWHYRDEEAAIADAMRLAEAMTHKASAAGLDLGGGKGVIATPKEPRPEGEERRAMLLDFGDLVESIGGRYVTAEDVGTGAEDMAVIAERTRHVVGQAGSRGGSGDPSPITALGVLAAIRASAGARFGSSELRGRHVVVIGVGHVGGHLAGLLAAEGAELTVTDIDPRKRVEAERLGAGWIEPGEALGADCDVLAPCALGGVVDAETVGRLRCSVLCGAANNVLAEGGMASVLAERDILYAPDFIANAGGLISVYGELKGYGVDRARELAAGIETTLTEIFATARSSGITPLAAARHRSQTRLARRAAAGAGERRRSRGGVAAGPARLAGSRLRHS